MQSLQPDIGKKSQKASMARRAANRNLKLIKKRLEIGEQTQDEEQIAAKQLQQLQSAQKADDGNQLDSLAQQAQKQLASHTEQAIQNTRDEDIPRTLDLQSIINRPLSPDQMRQICYFVQRKRLLYQTTRIASTKNRTQQELKKAFQNRIQPSFEALISELNQIDPQGAGKFVSQFNPSFLQRYTSGVIISKYLILNKKVQAAQRGENLTRHYKGIISAQEKMMQDNPQKWMMMFLKRKKIPQDSDFYAKMLNPDVIAMEMEDRKAYLEARKKKLSQQKSYFQRKAMKLHLEHIKQWTQLLKKKNQLYKDQNVKYQFQISQKAKQIGVLQSQMAQKESKYRENEKLLIAKAEQLIQNQRDKQKKILEQLQAARKEDQTKSQNIQVLQRALKEQQIHVESLQKRNQQEQARQKELFEETVKLALSSINQKKEQVQTLNKEKQTLYAEYLREVEQIHKQLQNFKVEQRQKTKKIIQQKNMEILQLRAQMTKSLEGRQMEFKQFMNARQLQFKSQISSLQQAYEKALAQKGAESEQVIRYAAQIQQRNQQVANHVQQRNRMLENHVQILDAELKRQKEQNQQNMQRAQQYIKMKEKIIDQLIEEKRLLLQKIKEMEQTQAQMQALLAAYTKDKIQTTFKLWTRNQGVTWTIRQCFKDPQKQKWIATTRGVNFTRNTYKEVFTVIKLWQKMYSQGSAPTQKQEYKIKNTSIMFIMDVYKGVSYYGLREYYYNKGQALPTRRGFNVAWHDLPIFFGSIKAPSDPKQIQEEYV